MNHSIRNTMLSRNVIGLLSLFLVALAGIALPLAAGHHHRCDCCPECQAKICVVTPEIKKEKKHYFEVECKDICIPGVKGPCQPCCDPPKCGRVRTVKVLKKKEYECEKCGYKWTVTTVETCPCNESCGKQCQ